MKRIINVFTLNGGIRNHSTRSLSSREEAIKLALKNQKWKQGIHKEKDGVQHHLLLLLLLLLLSLS